MGVDYSGNYGIGVWLCIPEEDKIEEHDDVMYMYIGSIFESYELGFDVEYFQTGMGAYDGSENRYFLCIANPFEGGIDAFVERYNAFGKFLAENRVDYHGVIGCVGGLHMY